MLSALRLLPSLHICTSPSLPAPIPISARPRPSAGSITAAARSAVTGLSSLLDAEVHDLLKMQALYLSGKHQSATEKVASDLAAAQIMVRQLRARLEAKDEDRDAAVAAARAEMAKELKTLERKIEVCTGPHLRCPRRPRRHPRQRSPLHRHALLHLPHRHLRRPCHLHPHCHRPHLTSVPTALATSTISSWPCAGPRRQAFPSSEVIQRAGGGLGPDG